MIKLKNPAFLFSIAICCLIISCERFPEKSNVDYVNPFIGAVTYGEQTQDIHGFGKTFPGAATPFGLVQLSPDTYTGGDNGCGYSWNHKTIEGFSFTHMSGVGWYGELGNFLVMPANGKFFTVKGDEENPELGYRSRYSHEYETASAGYYAVTLSDYGIRTELTAAPRAGIIRFTFPENEQSRIQIDLARRVGGTSTEQYIRVVDDHTLEGWMKCPPEGGGWGNGVGKADYTVFFYCQFSRPLTKYGFWSAEIPDGWVRKRDEINEPRYQQKVADAAIIRGKQEMQGRHLGFFTEFETSEGEEVMLKCGISFVDIDGARENLENDIEHWDFDRVSAEARGLWNKALSCINVEGGSEEDKIKFYTALYHTMIDPRDFSDVDGRFRGADGEIHYTEAFTYRTVFSGWDVFRSQFPLQTLINPSMVNDEINSLMHMAEVSGRQYLPRWEIVNSYSGCMLGNPAVSVILDAYRKEIRNYDVEKAFTYCRNSSDRFSNLPLGYTSNSLSHTLEYAYTDWCTGKFAELLGKEDLAGVYYLRSQAYRNLWNDSVNWFRARDEKGNWMKWLGLTVHEQGTIEANPLQQGWFVPYDVEGLKQLMGGEDRFRETLIDFFEATPEDMLWNDYYNHPNEPVHHVPFLFNLAGMPEQTQYWTRKICETAYGTNAFGLCGNEDVGQLSAWYVLAAVGIHPVCPGDNRYQITSPVFEKIEISLDQHYHPGHRFTILAKENSRENIYIKSLKLNGMPLGRYWISHEEVADGGLLEMDMTADPENR
jgi:predicted alpha-1,2-mannosidase